MALINKIPNLRTKIGKIPDLTTGDRVTIPNISMWLRSDFPMDKDGSDYIAAWYDQSGYGKNATQTNQVYKPLWVDNVKNGRPVVRFNVSMFNITAYTPQTVFVTFNITGTTVNTRQAIFGIGSQPWLFYNVNQVSHTANHLYVQIATKTTHYAKSIPFSDWIISSFQPGYFYENNTLMVQGDANVQSLTSIGSITAAPSQLNLVGDIMEIRMYSTQLTTPQMMSIVKEMNDYAGIF